MQANNNSIKIKIVQSLWLTMAFLCVVFTGAIKKIIKMHADHKISMTIHTDINGSRPAEHLRDWHREKHEVQTIVLSQKKQYPTPGSNPLSHLSAMRPSPARINLYTWVSSQVSYGGHEAAAYCPVPVYLLVRRLQV